MPETLHKELTTVEPHLGGKDYYKQNVPACIPVNLNPKFALRDYQREAFGRFQYYLNKYPNRPRPTQVLFQMATGSGKTLVMAGLILYLYQQGYRNFLFFVNSSNIIDKTIANFINQTASKYLFAEAIQIDDRQIRIREVKNFQTSNPADVNLVFSTIQGLHSRLNTPRENSVTYDDFKDERIVLISDEAHHINAETKQAKHLSKDERDERMTWESTVKRIFEANADNVLLEFTATADLTNEQILEKYRDKIIYDYPLKQFRLDGYSKEVKVLQADIGVMDRALQAVLLSQFRRKVFERHGQLIKPVILFKSRSIKESRAFFDEFIARMKSLRGSHLQKIGDNPQLAPVLRAVFGYFSEHGISLDNVALELREDFNEDRCIAVNSKDQSERKQIAVNTLEDRDNEYRAVFAVDKLNEGWDVLNLFDIVRLYDTRDTKAGKPGRTTLSEAQLIGRGARYCPFRLDDSQPLYKRKYDSHTAAEGELKVCEELYYHSAYNPRYIQELHTALEEIGIEEKERRQLSLKLKPAFKEKAFYKNGLIFKNERDKNTREGVTGLSASFIEHAHKVSLSTGYSQTTTAFDPQTEGQADTKRRDFFIQSFGVHVIRKALNQFPEYQFDNLQRLFPRLKGMAEFMTSEQYLGKVRAEVETSEDRINDLTQDDKLYIVHKLLKKLSGQLRAEDVEYKGTKEFTPHSVKDVFSDKTLNVVNDGGGDREYGREQSTTANSSLRLDLSNKDWFVFNENYGTSEEKHLVRYIDKVMDGLKQKYGEVYLVRNQQHFQLFNFDDGRAFEPDFVLFLVEGDGARTLQYQVIIEPKGEHLIEHDEWKQEFLMRLEKEHKIEQLWMDKDYVVWGMPFYSEAKQPDFEKAFGVLTD